MLANPNVRRALLDTLAVLMESRITLICRVLRDIIVPRALKVMWLVQSVLFVESSLVEILLTVRTAQRATIVHQQGVTIKLVSVRRAGIAPASRQAPLRLPAQLAASAHRVRTVCKIVLRQHRVPWHGSAIRPGSRRPVVPALVLMGIRV